MIGSRSRVGNASWSILRRARYAAAFLCVALWAPAVYAYPSYDNGAGVGCVQCHNQFQSGTGVLHQRHRNDFGIGNNCNLCHPSGGGTVPVYTFWSGTGGGYGCAGCHGQDYGEISVTAPHSGQPKATAYGLRLFHVAKGETSCGTGFCHAPGSLSHPNPFPPLFGEDELPPYYGQLTNNLTNPCDSSQEDLSSDVDSVGLDNDGDGAADYPADTDCAEPPTPTPTPTPVPFVCAPTPLGGCIAPGKGLLLVNEKTAGKEKLKVALKNLQPMVDPSQFGDPVDGDTGYKVCVYDGANVLSGEYTVERAGDTCGDKDCFSAVTGKGFKYKDPGTTTDGILKINLFGGDPGKGKVLVIGKNKTSTLPTGVAPALQNETSATVQVLTSDASCFGATLTQVKKADGAIFKALTP